MKIVQKSYNTLRVLSAEMIANSQVGDVRSCLVFAPVMFTLFKDYYNFFGGKDHVNRDRFVLADVSLTPLYYGLLNLFGINLSVEELKNFGEHKGQTPATPSMQTVGVDASISTKAQGIPTAVGLAIASQQLASKFNAQKFNVISHYTYCVASTSNLQEGVSQEAMSLAGSLKLSKLVLLCNYIEEQTAGENVKKKYKAMGWNVLVVERTKSSMMINVALTRAKLSLKPTLILFVNSLKKQFPQFTSRIIGKNEVEKLKADLGFNGAYKIDNSVRQYCARTSRRLKVEYAKWEKKVVLYRNTHPQLSEELNNFFVKPRISFSKALRAKIEELGNLNEANQIIVDYVRSYQKSLMVASIKEKLLPLIKGENKIFSRKNYRAQNLIFGNREGAMAEICAGVSLYFGSSTWVYAPICLLGQMLSGIEHCAQDNLPVLFCFYQSGACVNQQKTNVELYGQFEWLRSLANLDIYQPATAVELLASYRNIFERGKPACMVLAQQTFQPTTSNYEGAQKGAYIHSQDAEKCDCTLVASGREFYIAKELAKYLQSVKKTTKLISAPSWTVFDEQAQKYVQGVISAQDKNVVVLTRTNTKNTCAGKQNHFRYINVNEFMVAPDEEISPKLIKALYKAIY